MQIRQIRILGTGKYLPSKAVSSEELDKKLKLRPGWSQKKSGVKIRHYVDSETASEMGKYAIEAAMKNAGLQPKDIDCIVCTSGTYEQPIPCTAALIHKKLAWTGHNIPAFDINSTCLSFVTAIDTISYMIHAGRYKNVILVAAEISSKGLNWGQKESCVLFGDGAAAVVIGQNEGFQDSKILASLMNTYSEGAHLTEIRGGGTSLTASEYSIEHESDYKFDMDGSAIFKMASKEINGFVDILLKSSGCDMGQIKLVIPHQASAMAMKILRQKLNIPEERFMNIIENHGNTIAASIPTALHEAIIQGRIERGDKVMLIGTSAGLSIGGIVFEY